MAIRPPRQSVRQRLASLPWKKWAALLLVLAVVVVLMRVRAARQARKSTQAPPAAVANSDFTVFVTPGNGGTELGPVYPKDSTTPTVVSKTINLQIATATARALNKEGINAVLARDGDTLVDALERKNRAEQVGAKLAVAIYVNENYDDPAQAGIELIDYKKVDWTTHYKQRAAFTKELERAMLDRLHDFGTASTGVYTRNSAFVPDMPTVVLLVGFISNDLERERLTSEEYQWQIANAITDAAVYYRDQLQNKTDPPTDIPDEVIVSRLHVPF